MIDPSDAEVEAGLKFGPASGQVSGPLCLSRNVSGRSLIRILPATGSRRHPAADSTRGSTGPLVEGTRYATFFAAASNNSWMNV